MAGGVPFVSDDDLKAALDKAGVPAKEADAIVAENTTARIDGLRSSLSALAVIALIAMLFSLRIPTEQPAPEAPEPETPGPEIRRRKPERASAGRGAVVDLQFEATGSGRLRCW